ncbi:uncharacterized protein LOC141908684 [Tubulanus polymorphus]|uniref:uncharacterized protein LOC141908684 n=1 Tax=Tubulanus polymorphus TaxID=672921 RepID=UPI003DA25845
MLSSTKIMSAVFQSLVVLMVFGIQVSNGCDSQAEISVNATIMFDAGVKAMGLCGVSVGGNVTDECLSSNIMCVTSRKVGLTGDSCNTCNKTVKETRSQMRECDSKPTNCEKWNCMNLLYYDHKNGFGYTGDTVDAVSCSVLSIHKTGIVANYHNCEIL